MESSQAQLQHGDRLLQTNRDEAAYAPAVTLREITNHSKNLHDQLERAGSGGLQSRDSNSAASGPDAHESVGRLPVPQQPSDFHELNSAELIKAAAAAAAETAEQDSGKHSQPDGQPQAPMPDSMPQRTKPSPPSNSAASSPDAHDSADRVPVARKEPPKFIVLNIPELRKQEAALKAAEAAERGSGKRRQPGPLPNSMHTKPSPHVLSPPAQAGQHAHSKLAQPTATVQDPARHSSGNGLADKGAVPCKDSSPFIVLNIPELRKQEAALKAAGKNCQPYGQRQAPILASVPHRTKPSPHVLSLPVQAGHYSHAKHAQTNATVQGFARLNPRNDSADRGPVAPKDPSPFIVLNIPELRKQEAALKAAAAAERDSGKHSQPHSQRQASVPASVPHRTKPSSHVPSLPVQAGHHSHGKHAQTNATVQDSTRLSSRNDSANRGPVALKDPSPFIVLNIPELRKQEAELRKQEAAAAAAERDSGKHCQPHGQQQAPLPALVPQHTKPSPHVLSLPVQAGHHAHAASRHQASTTAQDPSRHSSRNESYPAGDGNTAAAAAAVHLVGMHRRATTDADQKVEQTNSHAPRSKQPNSMSAAYLHRSQGAEPDAGAVTAAAALVEPKGSHPYEANRAFQPPLSADPDNIAAWDTPRLEQLPVKLPEPRSTAHPGASALNSADPACKAGSAYDSPRAAQARGGVGVVVEESADGTWPAHVMVVCNSNVGKFLLVKQTMVCTCKLCQNKAAKMGVPFVDMTPTEFERHSGMAASKKWKYTVRIQQDGRPIGTWLEIHGYAPKATQRERPAPSDCKMATRERNRLRDRSKSSDISCEPSSSTLPTWQAPNGPSRMAPGLSRAAAASTAPAAAPSTAAASVNVDPRCNADLLVKAAAAVHRAEALQRAEASESDVSPRSRQSGPRLASEQGAKRRQREGRDDRQKPKRARSTVDADAEVTADEQQLPHAEEGLPDQAAGQPAAEARRVKRKTLVRPQLRESPAHQAVIPQRIGAPPAPIELPLRWEAGPSFEEAMASARGPEKAAADLLPLDATFDPETHEGAALSSHAGRHQRALPDKRARRKPGWLDGTIDPKTAAQLAIQHTTGIELDAQSDAEGNDSGGATCSNPELRWPNQRRLRAHPPTRKRDREDPDDGDMVEDSEWRGLGRQGKRNRSSREPDQAWTASASLLHSASNVPQRLRTVPRSSSQASNARAELDAVAVLGSMQPHILDYQPVNDNYLQISMKWGGRIYNGVINALPDQPAATGRQAARNAPSGYADAAAGESETFSPKARRGTRSPRRHPAAVSYDDYDTATHSPMAPPSGHDRGPHGPSRFAQAPRRFPAASLQSPEQPDTYSGAQFTPPSRGPNNEDGEVQSSSRRQATSAEPALSAGGTSERRATVDKECARLEQEGAPEGTRCALCHRTEVDKEDGWGRQYHGLGHFMLVRASTIQVAWVHSQCAWWSPISCCPQIRMLGVHEADGRLEGLPAEVRRGRSLKCKECGIKGATLGCHVATCRSSFHLPCARNSNCLLLAHERDMLLTCPQHRSKGSDAQHRSRGGDAVYQGDLGYQDAAEDPGYADHDMQNGDAARPRNLDRSGSHMRRPSNGEHSGSVQVGGRPLEKWELEDDAAGGVEDVHHNSATFKDWIRAQPDRNFDSDLVPNAGVADYLGGTVSLSANRAGRCAVCVVQRKGKCGSLSAPTKCRRKTMLAVRKQIQEEEHEPWLPQPAHRRKRT